MREVSFAIINFTPKRNRAGCSLETVAARRRTPRESESVGLATLIGPSIRPPEE